MDDFIAKTSQEPDREAESKKLRLRDAAIRKDDAIAACLQMVQGNADFQIDGAVTRAIIMCFLDNLELFCRKHHDYGRGNVQANGELGLFFRMRDKMARLANLHTKKSVKTEDEGKYETVQDLAIMALMLQSVMSGGWPGVDRTWDL